MARNQLDEALQTMVTSLSLLSYVPPLMNYAVEELLAAMSAVLDNSKGVVVVLLHGGNELHILRTREEGLSRIFGIRSSFRPRLTFSKSFDWSE